MQGGPPPRNASRNPSRIGVRPVQPQQDIIKARLAEAAIVLQNQVQEAVQENASFVVGPDGAHETVRSIQSTANALRLIYQTSADALRDVQALVDRVQQRQATRQVDAVFRLEGDGWPKAVGKFMHLIYPTMFAVNKDAQYSHKEARARIAAIIRTKRGIRSFELSGEHTVTLLHLDLVNGDEEAENPAGALSNLSSFGNTPQSSLASTNSASSSSGSDDPAADARAYGAQVATAASADSEIAAIFARDLGLPQERRVPAPRPNDLFSSSFEDIGRTPTPRDFSGSQYSNASSARGTAPARPNPLSESLRQERKHDDESAYDLVEPWQNDPVRAIADDDQMNVHESFSDPDGPRNPREAAQWANDIHSMNVYKDRYDQYYAPVGPIDDVEEEIRHSMRTALEPRTSLPISPDQVEAFLRENQRRERAAVAAAERTAPGMLGRNPPPLAKTRH